MAHSPGAELAKNAPLSTLWQQICSYFHIDEPHFSNRGKHAEAVVALSFMLVYVTAWASYVPLYAIVFQNMVAALAVGCIGLPTALGALWIQRKTQNLAAASALLNYGCVLTLIGCIFATGGTWSPIYFWSFSPVAGAYLLSGSRHGIAVTAIAGVGNGLVAYLTRSHENSKLWFFNFDIFSNFHVGYYALTVFLSMTVFSLIIYLFQSKLTNALHESEKAREEAERQKIRAETAFDTIKEQMAENKAVMNATDIALVMIFADLKIDTVKSSAYFQRHFPEMHNFSHALRKMNLESTADLIRSVIGESSLTWNMNESSFPLEAIIDGNTHELEWRKIENDDVVIAIVFAAKNVQPLLESKHKAESVGRYAKLLVAIVGEQGEYNSGENDNDKKNRKVFKAINRQIPQIKDAISRAEISLVDNWQPIYITLHTLKSEVNYFNFDDLKEFLHKTEDFVKNVRELLRGSQGVISAKILAQIADIKLLLLPNLEEILLRLQEVQQICRQTGADQSTVAISKDRLMNAKDDHIRLKMLINDSLFEVIKDIISGFEPEIYKIAGDLDKPSPRLLVSSPKYYLTDFAADKLKQALTHIIRNSLDHGIETRAERLLKGKAEIGELTFIIENGDGSINIRIKDDGKGLDLVKIREKALAQGLIKTNQKYSRQELADLIWLPGFSTTSTVSMVSGRGIGMEAVRRFIYDLDGTLTINLLDDSDTPAMELFLSIPKIHSPMDIQTPQEAAIRYAR